MPFWKSSVQSKGFFGKENRLVPKNLRYLRKIIELEEEDPFEEEEQKEED